MRTTKFAALFAAVALLVVGATFATFAADPTWVPEGEEWTAYDKNGNQIFSDWATSNGGWFYIGDEGYMLKESLVEDGDNTYYVDGTGLMVKDAWKKVEDDDYESEDDDLPNYRWFYFQSNGKAYKNVKKECPTAVGTYTFAFNEDGWMLWDWISYGDETYDFADDYSLSTSLYYGGTADEGYLYKDKWLHYNVAAEDEEEDLKYFYFDATSCKKVFNNDPSKEYKSKTIHGSTYDFNKKGEMNEEWAGSATISENPTNSFYDADGKKVVKGWFYTFAPNATEEDKEDESNKNWYYAKNKSQIAENQVVTDGGKFYVVDGEGVLQSGLVYILWEGVNVKEIEGIINFDEDSLPDNYKGIDYLDATYGVDLTGGKLVGDTAGRGSLYYLNEEHDGTFGAMKTGTFTLFDDYKLTFKKAATLKKGFGTAVNGLVGNCVYQNGEKLTGDASENKYWVVDKSTITITPNTKGTKIESVLITGKITTHEFNADGTDAGNYLITANGSFVKSLKGKKDSNDNEITVEAFEIQ